MKKSLLLACINAGTLTVCGTFLHPASAAPKAPDATASVAPKTPDALVANGSFEQGDTTPLGWSAAGADATHHLSLTKIDPHTGKQDVKMVADAGATSSYFSDDQYTHVISGATYTFSAWVKTDKVTGNAGWFYHVYKGSDIVVNNSLNVDTGLTGWSQVTATITVPEGADTVQIGTSLYGTGTAYFDDALLTKAAK